MKTIKILSVLFLSLLSLAVCGQETTKAVKRVSINHVFVQTGFYTDRLSTGTLDDFRVLAPESQLLLGDFSGFNATDLHDPSAGTFFSMAMGLQFSDKNKEKYKSNPLLRLGLSYYSGKNLSASYHSESRKPYDTLTSSQTGQVWYVDSVKNQNYDMDYSSGQIRFDGSLIFRTNPESRCSLYTGIGISVGMSVHSRTGVSYSQYNNTSTADGALTGAYDYNDAIQVESFQNAPCFGASAYIPLGIDLRLGNKNAFWHQLHLFYESRPAMNITSMPELGTFTNIRIQHGLGLRVSWI